MDTSPLAGEFTIPNNHVGMDYWMVNMMVNRFLMGCSPPNSGNWRLTGCLGKFSDPVDDSWEGEHPKSWTIVMNCWFDDLMNLMGFLMSCSHCFFLIAEICSYDHCRDHRISLGWNSWFLGQGLGGCGEWKDPNWHTVGTHKLARK